jgi:hypothetical protein
MFIAFRSFLLGRKEGREKKQQQSPSVEVFLENGIVSKYQSPN